MRQMRRLADGRGRVPADAGRQRRPGPHHLLDAAQGLLPRQRVGQGLESRREHQGAGPPMRRARVQHAHGWLRQGRRRGGGRRLVRGDDRQLPAPISHHEQHPHALVPAGRLRGCERGRRAIVPAPRHRSPARQRDQRPSGPWRRRRRRAAAAPQPHGFAECQRLGLERLRLRPVREDRADDALGDKPDAGGGLAGRQLRVARRLHAHGSAVARAQPGGLGRLSRRLPDGARRPVPRRLDRRRRRLLRHGANGGGLAAASAAPAGRLRDGGRHRPGVGVADVPLPGPRLGAGAARRRDASARHRRADTPRRRQRGGHGPAAAAAAAAADAGGVRRHVDAGHGAVRAAAIRDVHPDAHAAAGYADPAGHGAAAATPDAAGRSGAGADGAAGAAAGFLRAVGRRPVFYGLRLALTTTPL
mmetsp:Transcript_89527/g.258293  ORF Transcript_89527/g.258293 Transcript_89527/m.258293 type:complete len:417 (-) Transcript_89527:201-1451(-)